MRVRVAFAEGAAGAIVFGWTDEWWRGGAPIRRDQSAGSILSSAPSARAPGDDGL
jgi:hypothetical protein